jgi:hypothetical protein
MNAYRFVVLAALSMMVAGPVAAEVKGACPGEVAQAGAMVAKASDVLRGRTSAPGARPLAPEGGTDLARTPSGGLTPGTGTDRAPQADPSAVAGRTPMLGQGTGTARGLATSAASEISPWNPSPSDKTLKARTAKARKLTDQARSLCRNGKPDEARAKAAEAITVLDPK